MGLYIQEMDVIERYRRNFPHLYQVKEQFKKYDINNDGKLSFQELYDGIKKEKEFSRAQVQLVFSLADANENGDIDIREFIMLMFPSAKELVTKLRKKINCSDKIKQKFDLWDANKDGSISYEELREAAENEDSFLSNEDVESLFAVGDKNLDGKINFSEFSSLMTPTISDIVTKFRKTARSVKDIKELFFKFDMNKDGKIDKSEMHKILTNYKYDFSDQEVDIVFRTADKDLDEAISYEEFINLMSPNATTILRKFRETYTTLADVKKAFKKFDKNRDGTINRSELARLMFSTGHSYTDIEIDAIMNLGDLNKDGELTLEEFISIMSPTSSITISKMQKRYTSIEEVKFLFESLDVNSDGFLTKDEIEKSNRNFFDEEELNAIL